MYSGLKKLRQSAFRKNCVYGICLGIFGATFGTSAFAQSVATDWTYVNSPIKQDAATEAKIKEILGSMTLRQKVGQMTQAEIKSAKPEDVTKYYLGSVLNGGGSWPQMNKKATLADWVKLSDDYFKASLATDLKTPIPLIWGIDAVHGNNNIYGATLYPHNIGLGAARDPQLVKEIAAATAKSVRAGGINWAFAPTVAVVQNPRWGRTYESYSSNPDLVKIYAKYYTEGLQGDLKDPANVVGSVKHFLGDGGTFDGVNEGKNFSSESELINLHAQGYYGALSSGMQTVMITYSEWNNDDAAKHSNSPKGKIHGNQYLITDVLKGKMGFDGMVVSDYNAIGQVAGCTNAYCTQAVNAGIDLFMVPDDWKAFIDNTVKDVEEGRIPMARIDDAVTRILRVKMRSGLFNENPAHNKYAGNTEMISNKALARRAVSESLVLLKNNKQILPIAKDKKVLVVGKSADSMVNQSGGWSITWQGDETDNSDFPNGETLLASLKAQMGDNVVYSADGKGINPKDYSTIIAVVGETPYAETKGDIRLPAPLTSDDRMMADKDALKAVSGKGVPVITVLYSGRPLYINDILNLSDAVVSAWLPGTEAGGISDVILRSDAGQKDFRGRLSFPWPSDPCPPSQNVEQGNYKPLFGYGYGLSYRDKKSVGRLSVKTGNCPAK
jgi:beta-glucosidase